MIINFIQLPGNSRKFDVLRWRPLADAWKAKGPTSSFENNDEFDAALLIESRELRRLANRAKPPYIAYNTKIQNKNKMKNETCCFTRLNKSLSQLCNRLKIKWNHFQLFFSLASMNVFMWCNITQIQSGFPFEYKNVCRQYTIAIYTLHQSNNTHSRRQ